MRLSINSWPRIPMLLLLLMSFWGLGTLILINHHVKEIGRKRMNLSGCPVLQKVDSNTVSGWTNWYSVFSEDPGFNGLAHAAGDGSNILLVGWLEFRPNNGLGLMRLRCQCFLGMIWRIKFKRLGKKKCWSRWLTCDLHTCLQLHLTTELWHQDS